MSRIEIISETVVKRLIAAGESSKKEQEPSMAEMDIRWKQRFANFNKALSQLKKFIEKGELSELEDQGLVKVFENTYELAWIR